jgi:hypothetical protein
MDKVTSMLEAEDVSSFGAMPDELALPNIIRTFWERRSSIH